VLCKDNVNPWFEIVPFASSLGAEIRGIDLNSEIPPVLIRALKAAWVEYGVLLFRNQTIDDETQVRFARQFGLLQRFLPVQHVDQRPVEVFRAANTYDDGRLLPPGHPQARQLKLNWLWHTDSSYRECPIAGVILRGVRIAKKGGETVFANLRDAYEALPQKERDRIETLQVRHSFEFLVRHQDLPELGEDE
jgi:alpha-ketoglutarate-dependent taurine dioxygenase